MEYLNSIDENIRSVNEKEYMFIDVFQNKDLFFENYDYIDNNSIIDEKSLNYNIYGNRMQFSTTSKKIVFKVELKANTTNLKLADWNSRGFDVYKIKNNKYYHKTVFAPFGNNNIFSEVISNTPNDDLCVFLPNFMHIQKIFIGIERNNTIKKSKNMNNENPILFFGNSITQGASVSRSGNSYPNIISRELNKDAIIFYKTKQIEINKQLAEKISLINNNDIVILISLNQYLINHIHTLEEFISIISESKTDRKIIFLIDDTSIRKLENYHYRKNIHNRKNRVIIYFNELFDEDELDYIKYDDNHFSEYATYILSDKICEFLG